MTDQTPQPCPFCGGEAVLHTDKGPTGELYGWVGCNACDAMSMHCDLRSMQDDELHPLDAWNQRTPSPAHLAEIAALRAERDAGKADVLAEVLAWLRTEQETARVEAVNKTMNVNVWWGIKFCADAIESGEWK